MDQSSQSKDYYDESNYTVLNMETIVAEAKKLKSKAPGNFPDIAHSFVTCVFLYAAKVPVSKWKILFSEVKNGPGSIDDLVSQTSEIHAYYMKKRSDNLKYLTINMFYNFFRRLNYPVFKGVGQNIFPKFVCALLVKIYYARFSKKPSRGQVSKEIGEKLYTGYVEFKAETNNPLWNLRLTLSDKLKQDFKLNYAHSDRSEKILLEQEDVSDNEGETVVENYQAPLAFNLDNIKEEGKTLKSRLFSVESQILKMKKDRENALIAYNKIKRLEEEAAQQYTELQTEYREREENKYVKNCFRKLLKNKSTFITDFRQIFGFVSAIREKMPDDANFSSWAKEMVKVVNGSDEEKLSFEIHPEEFDVVIPTQITATEDNIEQNILFGWETEVPRDKAIQSGPSSTNKERKKQLDTSSKPSSSLTSKNKKKKVTKKVPIQQNDELVHHPQSSSSTIINVVVDNPNVESVSELINNFEHADKAESLRLVANTEEEFAKLIGEEGPSASKRPRFLDERIDELLK